MRNLVFISHANPEDNLFSRWLALQLAREGYRVWCDLTRLLGGEDFWNDIERVLREETLKFFFVTSRSSNKKQGPLDELQIAKAVERQTKIARFIVPLRVDDIPFSALNIQLNRKNGIDFFPEWATGLQAVLKLLREDGVPKDERFSPEEVARWWTRETRVAESILSTTETYFSNWFKVKALPERIYFHPSADVVDATGESFPVREFEDYQVSFARRLSHSEVQTSVELSQFLQGIQRPVHVSWRDAQNILMDLIRQAWNANAASLGLKEYELSGRRRAMYFKYGLAKNNRVSASGAVKLGVRQVVGLRQRKRPDGSLRTSYWHFAIEGLPQVFPELSITVFPHVFFSDDGQEIWQSKARLHSVRRSHCRNWWNPQWRDRILGTMRWMASDQTIRLQVGAKEFIEIASEPTTFESPVSYRDPNESPALPDDDWTSDDEEEDGTNQ